MIIVADAHVDPARNNCNAFFRLLEAVAETNHDLVFLGDIFELWVGFQRYETPLHTRFMAWCRSQKANRSIGFIEGNHEYFVAARRSDCFSWCTDTSVWQIDPGTLLCHGDKINTRDKNYLRFRKLVKNAVIQNVVRGLPFGPLIAARLKRDLKQTNLQFRKFLPEADIKRFADEQYSEGVHTIFSGHFHKPFQYRGESGGTLYIVPAWGEKGDIAVYDPASRHVDIGPWQDLLIQ